MEDVLESTHSHDPVLQLKLPLCLHSIHLDSQREREREFGMEVACGNHVDTTHLLLCTYSRTVVNTNTAKYFEIPWDYNIYPYNKLADQGHAIA